MCAWGYGGSSCELEAKCHFWDDLLAHWSDEGMRTEKVLNTSEVAGGSVYVRCIADRLPVNATEYAALWSAANTPPPPLVPPFNNATFAYVPTLLEWDENPVFHAVAAIALFNLIALIVGGSLKRVVNAGFLGKQKDKAADLPVHPTVAAGPLAIADATAGVAVAPLALIDHEEALQKGDESKSLPKLSVRFEVVGEVGAFNESAFLRRLATLVGVDDFDISQSTSTSAGLSNSAFIDVEICCPDATTLVMAVKTLKKAPGPLGMALGVRLVDSPAVTVPEPEGFERMRPAPQTVQGASPSNRFEKKLAGGPTIQERISPLPGRTQRRLLADSSAAAATKLGTDVQLGAALGPRLGVPEKAEAAAPLEGGIQERISMSGMTRSSRGPAALRLRAASFKGSAPGEAAPLTINSPPALAGRGAAPGLLGGLGMSEGASPQDSMKGSGIQERLPAMPGMRRQRATGEPRLRATNSLTDALRSCPPNSTGCETSSAPAAAAALSSCAGVPIQERVPRVANPPAAPLPGYEAASPPPSPPAVLPTDPSNMAKTPIPSACCSMVVGREAMSVNAVCEARLQTHPRVMPKGVQDMDATDAKPDTWDDRSVREIIWGITREHTLFGFVTALLVGDGPKLATIPQAAQLFSMSAFALLFLSCVQLRYMQLGASWASETTVVPAYGDGVSEEDFTGRIPFLSYVAVGAALIGWPCVLVARWLFYVANVFAKTKRCRNIQVFGAAWTVVLLSCGGLGLATVLMATEMDMPIVRIDVFVAWVIALLVQWLIYEPAMLFTFACLTLLLKWCTSFDDFPEVKAANLKKQREQELQRKLQISSKLTSPPPVVPVSGQAGNRTRKGQTND